MCRANPDCEEDGIEVNTTIWFNADDDAGSLDLAGLDDTGFEMVCPGCNTHIDDDELHKVAKKRIEEFAEGNDAAFSHGPPVSYESDRMRQAFAEIAKRFEDEDTREKFAVIVSALQAEFPDRSDGKDSS